jgi:hypothetical protein
VIKLVIQIPCFNEAETLPSVLAEEALRQGASVIVNTDGDHQYPGRYTPSLVIPILKGEASLVLGDRCPEEDRRNSWMKRELHWIGRQVTSLIASQRIPDPVTGFRAFSAEAARRIQVRSKFTYTLETFFEGIEHGFAIRSIPIETNGPTRQSRLFKSQSSDVFRSGVTLLRLFVLYHPVRAMLWLSCFLAILISLI